MQKRLLLAITLLSCSAFLSAQKPDTLQMARQLAWSGNFLGADSLLNQYAIGRLEINAMRLHGQILYWMQDYRRCFMVHEKAMELYPEVTVVRLDYARIRYELGHYRPAARLLDTFLLANAGHPEANLLRANIDYFLGKPGAARVRLEQVLEHYPEQPEATSMLQQISHVTAPYLNFEGNYQTDDQPLQSGLLHFHFGKYGSRFWHPRVEGNFQRFFTDSSSTGSLWLQAGNRFYLPGPGFSLDLKGGAFIPDYGNRNASWTGSVTLRQQLLKSVTLEGIAARVPYQHTLGSVQMPVLTDLYSLAFDLNHRDRWLGRAALEEQQFGDTNSIRTAYVWGLVPILSFKKIGLKVGYSFSLADSEHNRFEARESLDAIVDGFDPAVPIEGYYALYFTPTHQVNHGFLAAMNISPTNKIRLDLRANIPILARIDNPYLFLDKDEQDQFFINMGFAETRYTPMELAGQAGWQLGPRISMGLEYRFARFFFYELHQGSLHLNYRFNRAR